jgi:hypothetical protein
MNAVMPLDSPKTQLNVVSKWSSPLAVTELSTKSPLVWPEATRL